MIQQMLAIWSLVPLPFLKPAWTSGSSQFAYCWSLGWRILSTYLLVWNECNCAVLWAFFGIPFLWDWLALLGLEILVEGLIQSWLLWWSGQGNSTGLCKRTPRKEKEAKSKEKIRVFLRLTDSFSLTNCMCTLVTLGQALGIKTHVYSPPHSPWNLFTNQENRH